MRTEKLQTLAHRETLILGCESYADLWPELMPLARSHYEEVTGTPEIALNLATSTYEQLQAVGGLRMVTMRADTDVATGELIGYCSVVLSRHSHTGAKIARVDGVYVRPEWRSGTDAGRALLKHAMKVSTEEGATMFYVGSRPRYDLSPLLEWMGFGMVEVQYARQLHPRTEV